MPIDFATPLISQIGVVVHDLQSTMEAYHRTFGWEPWSVYEHKPPALADLRLRGEPAEFSLLTAETQVGPVAFELIQPLSGPSVWREWLATRGEGLHHIACATHPADGAEALMRQLEHEYGRPLTSGRLGSSFEFCYFDTQPVLKIIIEAGSGEVDDSIRPIRVFPA